MSRVSNFVGLLALGLVAFQLSLAQASTPTSKPDLSAELADGSVWQGLSRLMAQGPQKNVSVETSLKVVSRDGDSFDAEYWITIGANHGDSDRRGLKLSGTIDKNGKISAAPVKIIAGAWQNPNLLQEKWIGQVIVEKEEARLVMHRQMGKGTVEIGLVKKN